MTQPASIGDILAVLSENSSDIVDIVNKIGLSNLVRSGPAIYRIMKTVAERRESENAEATAAEFERVSKMLYYNDDTKESVRAFQRKHGLTPDGLIGDRTWRKVEELLKGK